MKEIIRIEIFNVIDFANARFKAIFDEKHKSLVFNTKDKVYLRLHHEYSLSKKENAKLSQQRFDSYTIKKKVDNVVYELNLSSNVRIHSIISIAQLKSAFDLDSFDRSRFINFELVKTEKDIADKKSYEIERVLDKRARKYEKITITQYLIK
jgi:uncharacterized protein YjaG (DUF416 family)